MCDRTPHHADHDSQMLATNAAALHQLEYPHCGGVHVFPCGDHFHVGHRRRDVGDACKARHADYRHGVDRGGGTLPESP